MANHGDADRASRTLYVTGFTLSSNTKRLLEELFSQGGPIVNATVFQTHAYILFQDEVSVPYCLALFNEVELNGQKLRLSPRCKTKNTYCYLKYLMKVREKLKDQYMKITPPNLPPKKQLKKVSVICRTQSKSLRQKRQTKLSSKRGNSKSRNKSRVRN